jgi:hypothetical protein
MKVSSALRLAVLCASVALAPLIATAQTTTTATKPAVSKSHPAKHKHTKLVTAVPVTGESKGVRILSPEAAAEAEGLPPVTPPLPTPAAPSASILANTVPAPPVPSAAPAPTAVAVVAPVIPPCTRPVTSPDLRLPERNFDRLLAAKLKTGKAVSIDLENPFPQKGEAPAPLNRWLLEVRNSGGQVAVEQYCDSAKGMLGGWLAKLFGAGDKDALYKPARAYDAVLHADALDRVVTQVEFTPKAVQPKS